MHWYHPREIAKELGVNANKVREWIASGELDAVNVGRGEKQPRYRINEKAYDAFLRKRNAKRWLDETELTTDAAVQARARELGLRGPQ